MCGVAYTSITPVLAGADLGAYVPGTMRNEGLSKIKGPGVSHARVVLGGITCVYIKR
jgi:hypothetical protein